LSQSCERQKPEKSAMEKYLSVRLRTQFAFERTRQVIKRFEKGIGRAEFEVLFFESKKTTNGLILLNKRMV
jgi:hypothetical protein